MKLLPIPSVSVTADDLAKAIAFSAPNHGVLLLSDLPLAPFTVVRSMFDFLSTPEGRKICDRLNRAYTKNAVFKDSFGSGNGGSSVDMKRVLDLSPERIAQIGAIDPEVVEEARAGTLGDTLIFWDGLAANVVPKLTAAVVEATGSPDVALDAAVNYRMVDYFARPKSSVPPRCGDHRDFGSYTLIFADEPGLQVRVDGEWMDVGPIPTGCALMLFGWCTQIRSNGRIPAALHRVVDAQNGGHDGVVPRRTSMVLFVAPKDAETSLEPVVREGEERKYISGIKVGMLRGNMARKWRFREGTLSKEDKIMEEEEILATKMKTQDDVVQRMIAV